MTVLALDTDFRVRAFGRPAPKGSRSYAVNKRGKLYSFPASKYEEPWVVAVSKATREARRRQPPPEPPYEVELTFYIAPPVRRGRNVHAWPSQHDLDKLVRAAIDGLVRGEAMIDDRHVSRLIAEKRWADAPQDAGVSIALRQRED